MKTLFHYLKKYKIECILAPLFKMIEATFELLVPFVIKDMINIGINNSNTNYIISRFLILIGFALLGFICTIIAQYFSAKAAIGFAKDVKNDLFMHIETLSFSNLDQIGTSSLITKMTSDVNQMQTGVNMFLRLLLRSPFVVIGALIMSILVNAKTAIIFSITIPLLSIIVFSIIYISIPLFKKAQNKLSLLLHKTRQNVKGTKVIRAFMQEDNETENFINQNNELTKFQIFVNKFSALMNPLTYVIINFAIIFLLYVGGKEVNKGVILQGDMLALYNYMSQILIELIKLANLTVTLTKAIASSKRVFQIFQIKNNQYFPTKSKEFKNDVAIKMENVCFKYIGNKENSLSNITFEVKDKMTVGVIGGTGSAKTTLINLLSRYYDIDSGSIYLYGNNIKEYSKKDLRKIVATAFQKSVLFKGTIRENLLFANENLDDDKLYKSLEIAQGLDIIENKEKGLDTLILENGKNLSGGQKQRLNIARTLLIDSKILILDDSFSALDYLTDKNLRKAILNKDNHPTLILVSQRISTIKDADMILVLDDGILKGIGTHESLLKDNEIYQEIYHSQTEGSGN